MEAAVAAGVEAAAVGAAAAVERCSKISQEYLDV
jgi:hypothetical protein